VEVPLSARFLGASKAEAEAAFQKLVETHAPYVWRALRSLGVAEADLPDISQETFLIVHRQLPSFEGRSSLRTWIYGIALRVSSDYRGKAYRRRELLRDELPDAGHQDCPHSELERREARRLVDALLSELDEARRQVFVLYEMEQLKMREVAEIVGCPITTAYSRLGSARDAIKASLAARREQETKRA
jgi:RNA polymerase sigma-70 factor (ECF subfamily)